MKKLVVLIHIIILASLSACKDDCLTCPENEAIVNGECQCIGVLFKGECLSLDQALMASTLEKTNIYEPLPAYISEKVDYNSIFDFNNQAMFFYLAVLSKRDQNTVETVCGIRTEGKDKAYLSQLRSPLGELSWDTLRFYAPSAFEYNGFVSNIGEFPGEHYTTEIDGQTCYLRPYIKILDKDYIRVTFRYVSATEEVKAECVRLFHR
jgi:hypothetical protein